MEPRSQQLATPPSLDFSATTAASNSPEKVRNHAVSETGPEKRNPTGVLIVNADDWGRDPNTTKKIFECRRAGSISSVSAMVFMANSEDAAALGRESGIDAGLHLNFTLAFSSSACPAMLQERQRALSAYLSRHSFAQVVFHPGLARSFEYVVNAQLDEYTRLYGASPRRIDGHHHMHLCANVQFSRLLPTGTLVRRNFSFRRGEKSLINRLYRQALDHRLAKRHQIVDFLFPLAPLEPRTRLENIRRLAHDFVVEVETHPVNDDEYSFLTEGEANRWAGEVPIATQFTRPNVDGSKL
jgi:chitin disaccharide deacetylase